MSKHPREQILQQDNTFLALLEAAFSVKPVSNEEPLEPLAPPAKRQKLQNQCDECRHCELANSVICFDDCVTWCDAVEQVLLSTPNPLTLELIAEALLRHGFSKAQGRDPPSIRNTIAGVCRADMNRRPERTPFHKTKEGLYGIRQFYSEEEEQEEPNFDTDDSLFLPPPSSPFDGSAGFYGGVGEEQILDVVVEAPSPDWTTSKDFADPTTLPDVECPSSSQRVTWKDAVFRVLWDFQGTPLSPKEIAQEIIARGYVPDDGDIASQANKIGVILKRELKKFPSKFAKISHAKYTVNSDYDFSQFPSEQSSPMSEEEEGAFLGGPRSPPPPPPPTEPVGISARIKLRARKSGLISQPQRKKQKRVDDDELTYSTTPQSQNYYFATNQNFENFENFDQSESSGGSAGDHAIGPFWQGPPQPPFFVKIEQQENENKNEHFSSLERNFETFQLPQEHRFVPPPPPSHQQQFSPQILPPIKNLISPTCHSNFNFPISHRERLPSIDSIQTFHSQDPVLNFPFFRHHHPLLPATAPTAVSTAPAHPAAHRALPFALSHFNPSLSSSSPQSSLAPCMKIEEPSYRPQSQQVIAALPPVQFFAPSTPLSN